MEAPTSYPLLAWSQGRDAYRAGKSLKEAPYRDGPMLAAWMKGWDAMKSADTVKHMAPRRAEMKSTTYLRGTHLKIAAVLDKPKTVAEIAQVLGSSYEAVAACLTGMRNRQEVVALKPRRQGEPRRYRLREVAA